MIDGEKRPENLTSSSEEGRTSETASAVIAWQPFTPRGIASFARGRYDTLMFIAAAVAVLAAVLVCWFVLRNIYPALQEAALSLPESGEILNQELVIPDDAPSVLVERRVLGIVVDLDDNEHPSLASEFQVVLRRNALRICSYLGCARIGYPAGWIYQVNRKAWVPGLEAWKPMSVGILFVTVVALLMIYWHALATLIFLLPWIAAYYTDRPLSLGGSWKLTFASLMPGAALMTVGVFFYGVGWADLVRFLLLGVIHLIVPGVVIFFAVRAIPKHDDPCRGKSNPFGPLLSQTPESGTQPRPNKNPFASGGNSPALRKDD